MPLAAVHARGQDATTGAVSGVVRDPANDPVTGASLLLSNDETGAELVSTSDRAGEFLFSALPPATYSLRVSQPGFTPLLVREIAVGVGRTLRLLPSLHIGGASQTVQVTAEPAPGYDSPANADLSPEELQQLPQDGRRFQSFAPLTPLVTAEDAASLPAAQSDDTSESTVLSFRGADPALNRYTLDGLLLTRAFDGAPRGGDAVPFSVPQEAVQEFQVRAVSGDGTSTSRSPGGSVATVTRRGADRLHGSAFFFLRNSGVGASNPFSVVTHYNAGSPTTSLVKPRDQREQFGGSVGGPLWHGLFAFVASEGQRRSFPAISSPADPGFYKLSPVQTALLANRGVGFSAAARGLAFLDSLTGPLDRHADEFTLYPRIDLNRGSFLAASLAWNHLRFRSPGGQEAAPVVARGRGSVGNLASHADSLMLHATIAPASRWLVDVRAGYSRDATFAEAAQSLTNEPHTGPGGAVPQIDISDNFSFGNASALANRRLPDERIAEFAAHLQFSGRSHTATLGAQVDAVDERIAAHGASAGSYSYTNSTSSGRAGGLVDFLTDYTYGATSYPNGGCPSVYAAVHYFCFNSFTQTFGSVPETRFHTGELTAFVSDGWRPSPHVRIDAGVRYEWNRLPPPQHPNAALDAVFGKFASTSSVPSDTNNVAPHLGIAYAPGTKTAIRLGYGYQFGIVPGTTLQRALAETALPASQTTLRITARTIIDPRCASAGTNFGYPATYICTPFGPVAGNNAAWVFARGFQMPAMQTGEASVTRELPGRIMLSGSYVVSLSRQLTNTTDLNITPSTSRVFFRIVRNGGEPGAAGGQVFNVPAYTARRTAAFGPVTGLLSNGSGTYHAAVLALQRRAAHGVTLRLSWTYGKSLDNLRTGAAAPNADAQFDPEQPLYDRAPSNFDRRNRIVLAGVWEPQVFAAERTVRAALGGWSIAPVFVAGSGLPYSYNLSGGTNLPGGRESLNGSGGANYLPTVGRNTLRRPWTANLDLRVARIFFEHDRVRLRLMAESFNLLNHVNVIAVEQRAFLVGAVGSDGTVPLTFQDAATIATEGLTGYAFGTPTGSAASPIRERRLQAGLRLQW